MKIGIIGATGMAGSAIFKAAQEEQIDVTAIVRNSDKAYKLLGDNINILEKDAFDLTRIDIQNFDIIVNAFATSPDKAYLHIDLASKLVSLLRNTSEPRLIFILGAGSLYTGNGDDQHLLFEDIQKDSSTAAWRTIPENQLYELEFLQNVKNVNWTGISPGVTFVSGKSSDEILYGTDFLLKDSEGKSETTSGTMAKAILKEIKQPEHLKTRFTVVNG